MICYMIFTLNSSDISKNRGKGFGYFSACDSDCRQKAVSIVWFPVLLPEMSCGSRKTILSTHCPRVSSSNHIGHPTGMPTPQIETPAADMLC